MRKHTNDYVRQRNALIPFAEVHADQVAGVPQPGEDFEAWSGRWNKVFHQEMDRLARARGIVR